MLLICLKDEQKSRGFLDKNNMRNRSLVLLWDKRGGGRKHVSIFDHHLVWLTSGGESMLSITLDVKETMHV